MSRIEQIISEIEDYIDSCKFQPLSNTKIVVNKDEIDELLAELRLRTPDEIKKYQKIINNKDAILNDAKQRADTFLAQANERREELISEHEIMQQAYAQANDMMQQASNEAQGILDKAVADANDIRLAAVQYTDDELANLEKVISHIMENISVRYDNFMKTLATSLEVVKANREQLQPEPESYEEKREEPAPESSDDNTTEYEDYTVNLDDEL